HSLGDSFNPPGKSPQGSVQHSTFFSANNAQAIFVSALATVATHAVTGLGCCVVGVSVCAAFYWPKPFPLDGCLAPIHRDFAGCVFEHGEWGCTGSGQDECKIHSQ